MSIITITCEDPSHPVRVRYTFERTAAGWGEQVMTRRRDVHAFHRRDATTQLMGDAVTHLTWQDPWPAPGTTRLRDRLDCPCGIAPVTVRRERLVPVLERLAEAGRSSISIEALRARVRK